MRVEVIPKQELMTIIKRFLRDENRGISKAMFAELAGIHKSTLVDVFEQESEPLSEYVQRRVSKAYKSWVNGEVGIFKNRDNTRFLDYRKENKPRLARSMGLDVVNGQIKLKVGVRNKSDYSGEYLDEKLGRK